MRIWAVIAALVLFAFYAAFAGQCSVTEMITMVIPVLAAFALIFAIHRVAYRRFDLRASWGRVVTRTCASLAIDSVKVGLVLLRCLWRRPLDSTGRTNRQPFHFGDETAHEATRRALFNLSVSASPDQYVIEMTHRSAELVPLSPCILHHAGGSSPTIRSLRQRRRLRGLAMHRSGRVCADLCTVVILLS